MHKQLERELVKYLVDPQPMVNKAPRPKNMTRGPMTEKGKMNLDYSIPGYTPYDKSIYPNR